MTSIGLFLASSQYVFPNETEPRWSALIVLYPYLTGLAAGAFILAALARVFNAKAVAPTYRLSMLTALAFLICAPLPLVAHVGHPEYAWRIFITPHLTSAMSVFGFVYLWYRMAGLLLEIWFDSRADIVAKASSSRGLMKFVYNCLTLGVKDVSAKALKFDDKACWLIMIIGIPAAFLLPGYVGFIFGSLKSNPWWSSVLMPVIFIVGAVVSGISLVLLIYIVTTKWRKQVQDMICLDAIGRYLMLALIVAVTLEVLDIVNQLYVADEWYKIFGLLSSTYLFWTVLLVQIGIGGILPLGLLAYAHFGMPRPSVRFAIYASSGALVLIGVLTMAWNVVIGGQLFSKSLQGLRMYAPELLGAEGVLMAVVMLLLPFLILWGLVKLLPPWGGQLEMTLNSAQHANQQPKHDERHKEVAS